MKKINKNIETLIVRSLDHDLNEQEQLELNRELIRNPDAREMLEQYQCIDNLAVEALGQVIGETSVDGCETITNAQPVNTRRFNRSWLMVPGAIAAAIMAIAIPRITLDQPLLSQPGQSQPINNSIVANPPPLTTIPYIRPQVRPNAGFNVGQNLDQNGMMQQVSYPRTRRNTGREMLGVVGEDGKMYWIEVDRIRTIRQNRPTPSRQHLNEM